MNVKTAYVSDVTYQTAMNLVNNGDFSSFSDAVEYCLRFLDDYAEIVGLRQLPEIRRENLRKISVRLPQKLLNSVIDRNLCKPGRIYELCLVFYFEIKKLDADMGASPTENERCY